MSKSSESGTERRNNCIYKLMSAQAYYSTGMISLKFIRPLLTVMFYRSCITEKENTMLVSFDSKFIR